MVEATTSTAADAHPALKPTQTPPLSPPTASLISSSCSLLSRLERIATGDEGGDSHNHDHPHYRGDDLSLLWSTVLESATADTLASSSAVVASEMRQQLLREVTGMMWGADYPTWMEEEWVRAGDVDADDEEEEEIASERCLNATGATMTAGVSGTLSAKTAPISADARGGALPAQPAETSLSSSSSAAADINADRMSTSWYATMQQALDALQLTLPLQEPASQRRRAERASAPPLAAPVASSNTQEMEVSAVATLANHLMKSTPMLWLRYLLVPVYTRWTLQRRAGTSTAGAVTMERLLTALSTAAVREAINNELDDSDAFVDLARVTVLDAERGRLPSKPARPSQKLSSHLSSMQLQASAHCIRQEQQRRTAVLLCFTGILARASHSFRILNSGGFALFLSLGVRLLGHTRAAWAEWAGQQSKQDIIYSDALADLLVDRTVPGAKRPRAGASTTGTPTFTTTTTAAFAASLAQLRTALSYTARLHAAKLWKTWHLLYSFYGMDLYTDDEARRVMEAAEAERAGLPRMSGPQLAQWQRLRMAAKVKQHTLSEAQWLWCTAILASAEPVLLSMVEDQSATASLSGTLYRSVLKEVLHEFLMHVRQALRNFATAALATRCGGLDTVGGVKASVLQNTLHNVIAVQEAFSHSLCGASKVDDVLTDSATAAMGVYLWQLYPTLLRVQVPDEGSWMGSSDGTLAASAVAVVVDDDDDDQVRLAFRQQHDLHWRTAAAALSATWSSTASCVQAVLAQAETVADEEDLAMADEEMTRQVRSLLFESPDISSSTTAPLRGIARIFFSVHDASCFFALRPERQRLFTRSIQRLYNLVLTSPSSSSLSSSLSVQIVWPLLRVMQADTRLWMLLTHGILLQLERRGRMAREDEVLLTTRLLPLLTLLGYATSVSAGMESATSSTTTVPSSLTATTTALPQEQMYWADLAVAQDILLLLASGLMTLPWDAEGVYLTVRRHTSLCARLRESAEEPATLQTSVDRMASWFTPAPAPSAATGSTTSTVSIWDLTNSPSPATSPTLTRAGGGPTPSGYTAIDGAAALARLCQRIDARTCETDSILQHLDETITSSTSGGVAVQVSDSAMEEALHETLLDHRRSTTAGAALHSGPCGLVLVVGAYRSLSRHLYRLRAAFSEQHRMARDDVGEFVGRTATFCTSTDISSLRAHLTAVHSCVFGTALRPRGLLRLWMGYLQQLFLCVVPGASIAANSGGIEMEDDSGTLTLMPTSWQRRHHVMTLFGARVYRTGWRSLQHDGDPPSHTRMREVLGECLAELLLLPYGSSPSPEAETREDQSHPSQAAEKEEKDAQQRQRQVLQHTFPHAVVETLCELLSIPVNAAKLTDSTRYTPPPEETAARGTAVRESFLGLAGLLAFLRRLELLIEPGSLKDQRLEYLLRCVYAAADAAAVGV